MESTPTAIDSLVADLTAVHENKQLLPVPDIASESHPVISKSASIAGDSEIAAFCLWTCERR